MLQTRMLTPEQVATALSLPRPKVMRMIKSGEIPAVKFSRRLVRIPETVVNQIVASASR